MIDQVFTCVCFFDSRCSAAFLQEERDTLEQRRNKIRLLQQRKLGELTSFKDLPEEIPMHLVIGTKVTGKTIFYFNFNFSNCNM